MKNASPGVFVSNNGKFAEQGGVLGVDYFSHPSLYSARRHKLINQKWGSRPIQRQLSELIIRENVDKNGECFVPWTQGGWISGKKVKGTMIKYSGYLFAHTGVSGAVGCVYPSEEI